MSLSRGFSHKHLIIICLTFIFSFILLLTGSAFPYSYAGPAPGQEYNLTILYTNDEHGSVIPHSPAVDFYPARENPTIGGYARLAAAVKMIREEKETAGEPVLLISGGDFLGGSAFSWLAPLGSAPELSLKQMIGYDAVVIGNHEYDYGPDVLANYLMTAGYPEAHDNTVVLASNAEAPPDHLLVRNDLFRDNHLMVLENGLKVGLFGLIGKDAVSVTAAHEPVEFTDQHETALLMVDQLREQGAQMIIAVTHSGVEEDRDLAREVPGIDVIVGGHCHTALHEPVVEGDTVIVQAGSLLEYYGRLELAFNPSTREVRIRNEENEVPFLHTLDYTIPLDLEIDAEINRYKEKLNALVAEKTAGRFQDILDDYIMLSDFEIPNHPRLQESPAGNFITDAMRLVTSEKTDHGADFAVQANGSIRGSITPGTMPHSFGKVSFYDLVEIVGLGKGPDGYAGYPIVAVYLTADEIASLLEVAVLLKETLGDTYFLQFSGLRYDYNPQNAVLFTVPFLDLPIPTTMAVTSAQRYIGEGRQGFEDDQYVSLEEDGRDLYCLVTDSYIVSFLPMVSEMLPQLDFVLKDQHGNPVTADELDQLIVYVDGEELKVWQTVVEYAANQPVGDSGLPEVDPYYASAAARINPVWTIPLITWLIIIILMLVVVIYYLFRRRKIRKKSLN